MKKIVLDAGHGKPDPGAVYKVFTEANTTLMYCKAIAAELANRGYEVLQTRPTDYALVVPTTEDLKDPKRVKTLKTKDLQARAEFAVKQNADMFISIHCNNFSDAAANGIETLYNIEDDIAKILQPKLVQEFKMRDRGVKHQNLMVLQTLSKRCNELKLPEMPACLIETGFLSNEHDRAMMLSKTYPARLAKVIADGIDLYFKTKEE